MKTMPETSFQRAGLDQRFPFESDLLRVSCDCLDMGQGPQWTEAGFCATVDAEEREILREGSNPVILYRVAETTRNLDLFRGKNQVCWVVVEGSTLTNQWSGRILDAAEAAAVKKQATNKQKASPRRKVDLDGSDTEILRLLKESQPTLLTQPELEAASYAARRADRTRKGVSVRTIQRRLPELKKKGLVDQPKGQGHGWGVTAKGSQHIPG
jgi:hypothetical protein